MNRALTIFLSTVFLATAGAVRAGAETHSIPEPPLIMSDSPKTVEDLVSIALENEATLRKAIEDEKLIGLATRSAYGTFMPSVRAGADFTNTRSEIPIIQGGTIVGSSEKWSSQSTMRLTVTEELFRGGARFFDLRRALLTVDNTRLSTDFTRQQLEYNVKTAVYRYLSAENNLSLAREILEQQRDNYRFAQARFASGEVIELDVMQAEIDVNNAENAVLEAEQTLENAREALNLAIGANLESRYPVQGELEPVLPDLDPDELVAVAIRTRPDYLSMKNRVAIQHSAIKSANAAYLPAASMGAQLQRTGSEIGQNRFQLSPESETRYYWFNLSWTLFDGFQRELNREQAVIEKRKAMWDLRRQEQQIAATIRQEWRSMDRLYNQIRVSDKNRTLARRQLDLEQERYRIGASSQLQLRNAQVTFNQSETDYIVKVFNFFTTKAALERDIGRPLEEVTP